MIIRSISSKSYGTAEEEAVQLIEGPGLASRSERNELKPSLAKLGDIGSNAEDPRRCMSLTNSILSLLLDDEDSIAADQFCMLRIVSLMTFADEAVSHIEGDGDMLSTKVEF